MNDNTLVAIISDIHFGVNKNSELFLQSSLNFFENQFVPYLKDNDISTVLVLGDVFDNRNSINCRIHDEVYRLFSDTLSGFDVKVLVGNHDIYYKTTTDVHSLKTLNHLPGVEVIDTIREVDILGTTSMFCPWIVDYTDKSTMRKLKTSTASILFGHFDIVGFALNSTRISDIGLDGSMFSNFDMVFSGHYHTPSSKKIDGTEIVYIGSPYQMNRNDRDELKGFIVLDVNTGEYDRIINNVSARFITIEYPDQITDDDVSGNIIDVHITMSKDDIINNTIDDYISKIEAMNPIDTVTPVITVINDDDDGVDMSLEDGVKSIPDLLEIYINANTTIPDDKKTELLHRTMGLYDEINK